MGFGCKSRGVGAGRRGELAQGFDDGQTRKGAKIGFGEGIAVVRFEGFGVLHQSREYTRQFTIERAQGKRVLAEFPIHAAQFFARENRIHPRAVAAWLKKNTAKNRRHAHVIAATMSCTRRHQQQMSSGQCDGILPTDFVAVGTFKHEEQLIGLMGVPHEPPHGAGADRAKRCDQRQAEFPSGDLFAVLRMFF
jgi:hypothetical protein